MTVEPAPATVPPRPADPADPGDVVMSLEGLEVHFPIRGGFIDGLRRRPVGVVRAVDGIDLAIRRGEVLGLVGESGSGKTTTGRVIVKLTKQTGGTVRFHGTDVSSWWGTKALREYRHRVQLIFQDPYETLNPKHTIGEFVAEPLVVNGFGKTAAERDQVVIAALEAAGLRPAVEFANRYPHELSGGQRQRVVIAGALVMDPELIVADEPVSMLDVSIRTELLRLMLELRAARGLTYLFITHDLSLAWVIADRIAVMYLGKIMEIGPAEAVIRSPQNPYTRALVSVSPSPVPPEGDEGERRTILVGETPDAAHIPSGCRFHPRCPLAFDRCRVEEPPLLQVGDGHLAACWLAGTPAMAALPVVEADVGEVPTEPLAAHDEVPGPMGVPGEAVDTPPVPSRTPTSADAEDAESEAHEAGASDVTVTRGTMLADALREDADDGTHHPGDR